MRQPDFRGGASLLAEPFGGQWTCGCGGDNDARGSRGGKLAPTDWWKARLFSPQSPSPAPGTTMSENAGALGRSGFYFRSRGAENNRNVHGFRSLVSTTSPRLRAYHENRPPHLSGRSDCKKDRPQMHADARKFNHLSACICVHLRSKNLALSGASVCAAVQSHHFLPLRCGRSPLANSVVDFQ
jgi:hypothetical protein